MVFLTNSVLLHLTKTGPSVHQQFIHAEKIFHTRSSTLVQHLMGRDLNPQHNIERNNVFDARHWTPCGLEFPSVNPRCHLSQKNIINSSNINIIINITCQDTLYQTLGWDVFQFIPRFWNTSGVASLCSGNFTRPLLEHVFIRPW